jgi:hypothetical protein
VCAQGAKRMKKKYPKEEQWYCLRDGSLWQSRATAAIQL